MSGVAPMDAAAKATSAPQQVVGQPVATPRAGDTYNSCTFNYNYAASAASDSASRGASPPRHAADGVPVRASADGRAHNTPPLATCAAKASRRSQCEATPMALTNGNAVRARFAGGRADHAVGLDRRGD